jgi:hypothetical protein
MKRRVFLFLLCFFFSKAYAVEIKNPFEKDTRSRELKYQYEVQKEDAKNKMDSKIFNLQPSGYMTVDEYEALSEYKDKSISEIVLPKVQTPSDFKYVPKPLYRIVKYNDPPGGVELTLGRRLYLKRQINAQGIVSPDFSKLVYPAIYYYSDSTSVASDMFVIPLAQEGTNLNKILTANVAKRIPEPILSTDKAIDNYATFRTLTPVDFSEDGSKILAKEKIGSREDGIWETRVFVYDFNSKVSYDLVEVRDAIVYFWTEYMNVNLEDKRWDIYPIGFDKDDADRIVVQAYAFTGEKPIFLGTWSIDYWGSQSRVISFDKNFTPQVSINGYKVIQDGVEEYQNVQKQEEILKKETRYILKERKNAQKEKVNEIKEDYKYEVKNLTQDYKEDYRDYKKLRSLSGDTVSSELQEAYTQYLIDQYNKDIQKTEKQIEKQKHIIEKTNSKIEKLNNTEKKSEGNAVDAEEPTESVQ